MPDVLAALADARRALDDLRRTARDLLLPQAMRAFCDHSASIDRHFGTVLEHVRAAELNLESVLEAGTLIPLIVAGDVIHGRTGDIAPGARCIAVVATDDPDLLAARIARALRIAAQGAHDDAGQVTR